MTVSRRLLDNLKNLPGWHTRERLVVFAVDDYGNVRIDSKSAQRRMEADGLRFANRFDRLDTVETRDDLEQLFEVLTSVTDAIGRHVVFTPYVLTANPDFDALQRDATTFAYEPVTRTFERLAADQPAAYRGTWDLWMEGLRAGLLRPQFHGREHVNVELIERQLRSKDEVLAVNLANGSMAALNDEPSLPSVGFTHAFGFYDRSEVARHREIIADGLRLFEDIFGSRSVTFTPPAQRLHPDLYEIAQQHGVRAIHKPLYQRRRIENHSSVRELNWLGKRRRQGHATIVRNVVFEPTDRSDQDSVALALKQIEAAFRWHKPAIISSHRVNYCGHIDEANRTRGLEDLERLLKCLIARWPDVRFIGADELVERMEGGG
jgi:hypothetical protein